MFLKKTMYFKHKFSPVKIFHFKKNVSRKINFRIMANKQFIRTLRCGIHHVCKVVGGSSEEQKILLFQAKLRTINEVSIEC